MIKEPINTWGFIPQYPFSWYSVAFDKHWLNYPTEFYGKAKLNDYRDLEFWRMEIRNLPALAGYGSQIEFWINDFFDLFFAIIACT